MLAICSQKLIKWHQFVPMWSGAPIGR